MLKSTKDIAVGDNNRFRKPNKHTMKTKVCLAGLIVLSLLLYSCKKIECQKDYTGIWNYVGAFGGYAAQSVYINQCVIQIRKNNHYFIYRNDSLVASGEYSLYKVIKGMGWSTEPYDIYFKKGYLTDPYLMFPFDTRLFPQFYTTDTLVLNQYCADCYEFFFVRQK